MYEVVVVVLEDDDEELDDSETGSGSSSFNLKSLELDSRRFFTAASWLDGTVYNKASAMLPPVTSRRSARCHAGKCEGWSKLTTGTFSNVFSFQSDS